MSTSIKQQFNEMIERGTIPCFEYELKNDEKNGIAFSFDSDGKRVAFDDEIIVINDNHYFIEFDEYIDSLDDYLQMIDSNITEGYLLVNDLYKGY